LSTNWLLRNPHVPVSERIIRWLDGLHSRSSFFLGSILLLGVLLGGTSIISWQSRQQEQAINQAYSRTSDFLQAAHDIELATLQMMRGERGYLITGNSDYLQPFDEGRANIEIALSQLRSLDQSDRGSLAGIAKLDEKARNYTDLVDRVVELAQSGNREEALRIIQSQREREAIEDIRHSLLVLVRSERRDLDALSTGWRKSLSRQRLFFCLVSAVGLVLVILASLSVVTLRRVAARERAYRDELRRLAQTHELTGLANRRETMNSLKRALSDA